MTMMATKIGCYLGSVVRVLGAQPSVADLTAHVRVSPSVQGLSLLVGWDIPIEGVTVFTERDCLVGGVQTGSTTWGVF